MITDQFNRTKTAIRDHISTLRDFNQDIEEKDQIVEVMEQKCKSLEQKVRNHLISMNNMKENIFSQINEPDPVVKTRKTIYKNEKSGLERLYNNLCQTNDVIQKKIELITENIERLKQENKYLGDLDNLEESNVTESQYSETSDQNSENQLEEMKEKYQEINEQINEISTNLGELTARKCTCQCKRTELMQRIPSIQEDIEISCQNHLQKLKKLKENIREQNDNSICEVSWQNNVDFQKHKLNQSKKKLEKKIDDTNEELSAILSAKELFTEKQNMMIDKINKIKTEKNEIKRKTDEVVSRNLKLLKEQKFSLTSMRNDIEDLKLQTKHEKTLIKLSNMKICQLEQSIADISTAMRKEEYKSVRQEISTNNFDPTNLNASEHELIAEALAVTIEDIYRKRTKKLAEMKELEEKAAEKIENPRIKIPKFYSKTKGELKEVLKEILDLNDKIESTEKLLKEIKQSIKDIHKQKKIVKKLEISLKQDHIIQENEFPYNIMQIKQNHASETSRLQREISMKMLKIDEIKSRINKKQKIFDHITSHYDISKNILDFIIVTPKYDDPASKEKSNREQNLSHLIFILESCLKGINEQLNSFKFASIQSLYGSLNDVWNASLDKQISKK